MAFGPYCWTSGKSGEPGVCGDVGDPYFERDLPRIVLHRVRTARFHLGFTPTRVRLTASSPQRPTTCTKGTAGCAKDGPVPDRTYRLKAKQSPTWDVRGRATVLSLMAS